VVFYVMGERAQRKKQLKKFAVGDLVTWGTGKKSHIIVEVTNLGVYVDATSEGLGNRFFVPFVMKQCSRRVSAPLRHA